MPATPTTGTSGNSYATIAEADTFLDNSVVHATAWEGLDDDTKARALLTATILLDKQCWIGAKADSANTLEWPRTGVVDKEGEAVDDSTVPDGIINGAITLAAILADDPDQATVRNTGSNDKRYRAGSVEIEFFRPGGADGPDGATRFPWEVMEFIGEFLQGSGSSSGAISTGTDACSSFDNPYDLNEPLS